MSKMEYINKTIQDILEKENVNLDTLYNDINTNDRDSKTDELEQVIISCINNKNNGIEMLQVLFEYKNMEKLILSKIDNKRKIMNETAFQTVSVDIFIFLFEKLQYVLEEETCLTSLFVNVINCDEGKLEKLKYLINHDDLRWFLIANNFRHLCHLLLSAYNVRFEKFVCVSHSKFMDNKLLNSINVGGKCVNLLECYFESYLQYQINTGRELSNIIDKFRYGHKNYTIKYINRYVYRDTSRLMYPKIDYEYEIIRLVKSGYVERKMFIFPGHEFYSAWFREGLKYGTTRIVVSFVENGLLTIDEDIDFCKKIHLTKYQVVMRLFKLIIRKKNEKIYDESRMRLLFNKGRAYNSKPQLSKGKILN